MLPIFVITLPDCLERRRRITEQMEAQKIPFSFIFGVDGRKLTHSELAAIYDGKKAKKLRNGNDLNPGEIGCAASHAAVYKKMVDEHIERAVIIEDDALIQDGFSAALHALEKLRTLGFIVKLDSMDGTHNRIMPWHKVKLDGTFTMQHTLTAVCTTGYYIDRKAAMTMHKLTKKICRVADDWDYFCTHIRLRTLNKTVVGTVPVTGLEDWFSKSIIGSRYLPPPPNSHFKKLFAKLRGGIKALRTLFH